MIEYIHENDKLTCRFEGRWDTAKCQELEREISDKISGVNTAVVFDLEKVRYVASAFLRICLKTAKAAGERRFSVAGVSPEVKKVFKIAGFDKLMAIE